MPVNNDDAILVTQGGLALLGKALTGKELTFTRIAFGDSEINGTFTPVAADDVPTMTNLINWRKDLPILNYTNSGTGEVYITFLVANADVQEGFWMRELGIFARDPDTQAEILYAYQNKGLRGGWLPATGGNEVWEQQVTITVVIAQAANVTVIVNEGGGGSYNVDVATKKRLGVVQIGYGLNISKTGVLSRDAGVILDSIPSAIEGAMWYIPASN